MLSMRVCRLSHKKRFENRPRGDRPGNGRENSVHDASTSHSIGGGEIGNGKNHKRRCRAKSDKTDQAKNEEEIGEVRVQAGSSYTKKREKSVWAIGSAGQARWSKAATCANGTF